MRTSDSIDKICAALATAQAACPTVPRSGTNPQQRYKYAECADFFRSAKRPMAEAGLALVSTVTDVSDLESAKTRGGAIMWRVRVTMVHRLVHTSGQWVEIVTTGEGSAIDDKATYKAVTGARKYGLACLLGLASSDDPETETIEPAPQQQSPEDKLHDRCRRAVERYKGVASVEELEEYVDAPVEDWGSSHLARLRAAWKRLATLPEDERRAAWERRETW